MSFGYRKHKYNAKKCWVYNRQLVDVPPLAANAAMLKRTMEKAGGVLFDSQKEAKRFIELLFLEDAGEIKDLELQPKFPFIYLGKKVGKRGRYYKADFKYKTKDGEEIVEDVKGFKTKEYELKRDFFLAFFPQYKFIET